MSQLFWFFEFFLVNTISSTIHSRIQTSLMEALKAERPPVTNSSGELTTNIKTSGIELYHYYPRLFYLSNSSNLPLMHLLLVDSKSWICTSTEAQNQPHFPEDDVLLLLSPDPCGSFALSFVDFGWKKNFFFIITNYYCTSHPSSFCEFFCACWRQNIFKFTR